MNEVTLFQEAGQWFDGDLARISIPSEVLDMVDQETALRFQVVPVGLEWVNKLETLILVTHLIENAHRIMMLQERLRRNVQLVFTTPENIKQGLITRYNVQSGIADAGGLLSVAKDENEDAEEDITDIQDGAVSPFVEKVNNIILGAIKAGASDIHIQPLDAGSQVFFRIHNDLEDVSQLYPINGKREKLKIVNRFKIMCEPKLDIGKRAIEQKGGFQKYLDDKIINFRVSVMPTLRGEKVVIRLLDPFGELRDIDSLGFFPEDVQALKRCIRKTHGLNIWVGPTGAGKTSSIYALTNSCLMMNPKISISTIEDPPEYNVPRYAQVLVSEAKDFDLMSRAILRQDPDLLIIGEIRTEETARIVLQAAQTGHKVFTTLHATDCMVALARLCSMKINRLDLLTQLTCIASQRLVKVNCPSCAKHQREFEPGLLEQFTAEELEYITAGVPQQGSGCPECNQKGYIGRMAVGEFLFFDNKVRDFFRQERSLTETETFLREEVQFKTMWDKGLQLVREGKVSLGNMLQVIERS